MAAGEGVFGGLVAFPITPADPEGRVDADRLSALVDRLAAAGVDAVGLLGSTGTYAYLSRAERGRAVTAAREALAGRASLVVCVGALRTDAATALARDAEAAGADALLLAPVSYTPLLDAEVFRHFETVAGATGAPICIYNNPSTTRFTFSPALIERLAASGAAAAVKNPGGAPEAMAAEIADLRGRLPAGFSLGYSGDWFCAEALLAGADAWHCVAAGVLPAQALRLARAAQAGDRAEAERIDALFQPLWALFREFGSLRACYAAAALMGLSDLPPPLPLLPLSQPDHDRVAAALDALEA
ncbi:dihydrodipicolinate synthase family protein [Rubrimonas cliftonensis]|uniref:4-hydroxy-tetrahydrodipicolinate synthase n=1 Tax=Rubrimonas cliftonensis TaxID=89524 RepID=A0A1H3XLV2_9RHOB|nr:dihydrodipicolinate synthase family protein [Rubrimonas cliftonensis]SDZ99594.1 4-hydroxy-tetrahydrodipicolinate synthase [Rubrimonas cliftonensis]